MSPPIARFRNPGVPPPGFLLGRGTTRLGRHRPAPRAARHLSPDRRNAQPAASAPQDCSRRRYLLWNQTRPWRVYQLRHGER